ncbi:hypothetical protein EVAR_74313_1 [Eumeta japonica]|uniref:Uncharacterized protein n=1 Tax=Eumeta variegata TaxID=151549 RepID=A0A4C1SCZ1_EUMVA|nr:hypothetical protein EVAR_74313_1 [Eumeta japonica]
MEGVRWIIRGEEKAPRGRGDLPAPDPNGDDDATYFTFRISETEKWNIMCRTISAYIERSFIYHNITEPPSRQYAWDEIGNKATLEKLLEETPDATNKARLRGALISEPRAWLHGLSLLILRTLLNDKSLREAVTIRLSCYICEPHLCICD